MNTYYGTFSPWHPNAGRYVVVQTRDIIEAYNFMLEQYGCFWDKLYATPEEAGIDKLESLHWIKQKEA